MQNPIPYYVRTVYGNDHMYIADPAIAKAVAQLTGKKTIDWRDIAALETLGHRFAQVLPPGSRNYGKTTVPAIPALDFAALVDLPFSSSVNQ